MSGGYRMMTEKYLEDTGGGLQKDRRIQDLRKSEGYMLRNARQEDTVRSVQEVIRIQVKDFRKSGVYSRRTSGSPEHSSEGLQEVIRIQVEDVKKSEYLGG